MHNLRSLFVVSILLAQFWRATAAIYRMNEPIKGCPNTYAAFVCTPAPLPQKEAPRDTRLFARRMFKLKLRAAGKFRIKPKTNKSVAKRFKITATGKIMYKRAGKSHLQRKKSQGAKRRLRRAVQLKNPRMIKKILSVLHNR